MAHLLNTNTQPSLETTNIFALVQTSNRVCNVLNWFQTNKVEHCLTNSALQLNIRPILNISKIKAFERLRKHFAL